MDLCKELVEYCNRIVNDTKTSCQKHRWSCQRYLNDIKKQKTKVFPYEFKPEKAIRFYKWCNLFKHRKGVLAGKYIELHPIARFIFGNIYGWYHIETGYRRFNKLYWQVARKNAKSQYLSLVGSYELMAFDETCEEINEVYCAATKKDQARIVYDGTVAMLYRCEDLEGCFDVSRERIVHLKSDSYMRVLNEEDQKKGDGLNPQCSIIDEYHAHPTTQMYDVLDTGKDTRCQPLFCVITTAGENLMSPCYTIEYQLCSKILNPDIPLTMENYFVMINELDKNERGELIDDVKNPEVWEKANPIVCSYQVGYNGIKTALKEALEFPEKMKAFLIKRMNVWVHLPQVSYLDVAKWNLCKKNNIPSTKDMSVYIGLDLSNKNDLTSVTIEIPYNDKYIIYNHSFIPEETLYRKIKTDKVPYDIWVKNGWLTAMTEPIIDYKKAIDKIREMIEVNNWYVCAWCFDPWSAGQIMSWMQDEGEIVIAIRQGPQTLSEPTKDFRDMIISQKIIHDGNPLLAWALSNAMTEEVGRNKNIMLTKSKSTNRIDPAVATINAHTRAMLHVSSGPVVITA